MAKWNFVAMGQAGLTGWARTAAQPVARLIARRTGRPEADILALIGAGFPAITVIDFLRNVDAVIAAGRNRPTAGARPAPSGMAETNGDERDTAMSPLPGRWPAGANICLPAGSPGA